MLISMWRYVTGTREYRDAEIMANVGMYDMTKWQGQFARASIGLSAAEQTAMLVDLGCIPADYVWTRPAQETTAPTHTKR